MRKKPINTAIASADASIALDAIDRNLLALLQANARESVTTLGKKLGVARTTYSHVWRGSKSPAW